MHYLNHTTSHLLVLMLIRHDVESSANTSSYRFEGSDHALGTSLPERKLSETKILAIRIVEVSLLTQCDEPTVVNHT